MSPVDMGDDMAVILDRLGYEQVDVMGYSLGGGVAFWPRPSIRVRQDATVTGTEAKESSSSATAPCDFAS